VPVAPRVVLKPARPIEKEEQAECPVCGKLSGLSLSSCPHCGAQFDGKDTDVVAADPISPRPKEDTPQPSKTGSAVDEAFAEAEQDAEQERPLVVREKG